MTDTPAPSTVLLSTNKYPDRRAPPTRLKDHSVEAPKAPSAAQRFLLAKRVNAFMDASPSEQRCGPSPKSKTD